ncbi:MAG: hypothetical protein M5U19_17765 [Microthrixaceae bacterium]|nr:hypothetical protein [Microthrixaceae bacterium]
MTPDTALPPVNDAGYTQVREILADGAQLFGRDDFKWAGSNRHRGHRARLHLGGAALRGGSTSCGRGGRPTTSTPSSESGAVRDRASTRGQAERLALTASAASC